MSGARDIAICSNRQTGKKRTLTVQSVQADVAGSYDDVAETVRPYADVACDDVEFLIGRCGRIVM
jgi:hypothetical protein